MRLAAPRDRAHHDDQVDDPDEGEPEVDVPLRLGVFAALGDAQDVARGRHDDEQLVAPEQEPGEVRPAEQRRPAGALDHVQRGADQRVAAEGEDHRRGVDRPQPAEMEPGQVRVERGVGELERDDHAHGEADDAPEQGRDHEQPDDALVVAGRAQLRQLRRRWPSPSPCLPPLLVVAARTTNEARCSEPAADLAGISRGLTSRRGSIAVPSSVSGTWTAWQGQGIAMAAETVVTSFDVVVPTIRQVELDRPVAVAGPGLARPDAGTAGQRRAGAGVRARELALDLRPVVGRLSLPGPAHGHGLHDRRARSWRSSSTRSAGASRPASG